MIDPIVVEKLKERYPNLHPLIFHRSVERVGSAGELFDILEDFPKEYPVIWDEEAHSWKTTDDLFQVKNMTLR